MTKNKILKDYVSENERESCEYCHCEIRPGDVVYVSDKIVIESEGKPDEIIEDEHVFDKPECVEAHIKERPLGSNVYVTDVEKMEYFFKREKYLSPDEEDLCNFCLSIIGDGDDVYVTDTGKIFDKLDCINSFKLREHGSDADTEEVFGEIKRMRFTYKPVENRGSA